MRPVFDQGRMWGGANPAIGLQPIALAAILLIAVTSGLAVALGGPNALYLCASLAGSLIILFDFRIGVVLLVLLMPASSSEIFPRAMFGITGLNPLNLLLLATLGSYVMRRVFDKGFDRFVPGKLLWLYVMPFLVAGALGASHVGDIAAVYYMYGSLQFNDAAGYIRDLVVKPLFLVLFALLIAAAVSQSKRPEKFLMAALISIWIMGAMVIAFVIHSGIGLAQLASSESRGFLSPLGMHANDLGRLFLIAYALLLFTWAQSKSQGAVLRSALVASMVLVTVALVLTFSRGAFLGFAVVNVLFLISHFNAKTFMAAVVLLVAAFLLMPGAVYDRILTGQGEGLNVISAGRIEGIWVPLWRDVMNSPIYGSGLGSILWSETQRRGLAFADVAIAQAHNAYLEIMLDMGIIGLALVCAYFVHVWLKLRKLAADAASPALLRGFFAGGAAGLLAFLVAGIAGSYLTPRPEQVFLWFAIGMMYGQEARIARNLSVSRDHARNGTAP